LAAQQTMTAKKGPFSLGAKKGEKNMHKSGTFSKIKTAVFIGGFY